MIWFLLACIPKPTEWDDPSLRADPLPPGSNPETMDHRPPSPGTLDQLLEKTPKAEPPCGKLVPQLWPLVTSSELVEVVVDALGPLALPADFVVNAEASVGETGTMQGTVPGTSLCTLAGLDNVLGVRLPVMGHAKP